MQSSSSPKKISVPFANTGEKQNVPDASQIGIDGGRASYTDGFPPLTRTPISAGGIPPYGTDFNGVLFDLSSSARWTAAGGAYSYDSTFSTSVGGYPKSSILLNDSKDGLWLNTAENNIKSPESSNSGWVPFGSYGITYITATSTANIVLTPAQASKKIITLYGNVGSPVTIIFPTWVGEWTIINRSQSSYFICKTASGSFSATIWFGATAEVVGNGADIIQKFPSQRSAGGGCFINSGLRMMWGSTPAVTNIPTSSGAFESAAVTVTPTFLDEGITYIFNNIFTVSLTANDIGGVGLEESSWRNSTSTSSFTYLCSSRQNGATLYTSWLVIGN